MRPLQSAHPRLLVLLVLAGLGLLSCRPHNASRPAPLLLPEPDSLLIQEVGSDSLRLRVQEPGFVLVFALRPSRNWYLAHPLPFRSAAYLTSDSTIPILRVSGYTEISGYFYAPEPSQQMCAAVPSVCSMQTLSPPRAIRLPEDDEGSYVVVITAINPPDREQLSRRLHFEETPRRTELIPRWLAEQVARLSPVLRWSTH
jgi:hypothetical protein